MIETKEITQAWINYCIADSLEERPIHLQKFIEKFVRYDEGTGNLWVSICIEDDKLCIDLSCGFHCLYIPLELIDKVRKTNQSEKT